jgi:hypothetical protein
VRYRHNRYWLEPSIAILTCLALPLAVGCGGAINPDAETVSGTQPPAEATSTPEPGTPESSPTPIPTPTPVPYPIVEAQPGEVVITEIMVDPQVSYDSDGEWFEVRNVTSDRRFDLSGWKLVDHDGSSHTVTPPEPLLIAPGERLVLGRNADVQVNGRVDVAYAYTGISFANQGVDGIALVNGNGTIDEVEYQLGDGDFPDLEGRSLSLDPSAEDAKSNDIGANWCAAFVRMTSGDSGSPGSDNPPCGTDADNDFYPSDYDCDDSDAVVNADAVEVVGNTIDDDCDGIVDETPLYAPGNIVITEIMYQPGYVDERLGEWIEVYNTTDKTIDLRGWSIGNADERFVIDGGVAVPPGVYVVLGNNSSFQTNGGLYESYAYKGVLFENEFRADRGYADTVRLISENVVIDAVAYDGGVAFPDGDGASIQLVPDGISASGNDMASAWCRSYSVFGNAGELGTPGQPNDACLADADGDGYNEKIDCDDQDANTYPGASEIAGNSKDDDCDGVTDEETVAAGAVIIDELMIDTSVVTDGSGEYIELFNTTAKDITLNGWTVRDSGSDHFTIGGSSTVVIKAHSYLVLGVNGYLNTNGGVNVDYVYGNAMTLDNTADEVMLVDDGTVVDQVAYDNSQGWTIPKGRSLGLSPTKLDAQSNDDSSSWCAATTSIPPGTGTDKGTPGATNDVCP